ncbi:GatB/YqeY domain-containing protein [Gynuella sp.]|uniref:GatB/YqeY domain-containing protein n=1 Tax=Gynuella sp. TaxID=2969146 RepID=UPI003D0FF181
MSLKERLQEEMKSAMRAKDKDRLSTIRLMLAELKRVEVDERIELPDERILAILDKMQKQRRDSINQFEQAKREDLAAKERSELEVIAEFLPEPLGEAELNALIDAAIAEVGASSMADMGKVMALVKPKAQGRADMSEISKAVKGRLG